MVTCFTQVSLETREELSEVSVQNRPKIPGEANNLQLYLRDITTSASIGCGSGGGTTASFTSSDTRVIDRSFKDPTPHFCLHLHVLGLFDRAALHESVQNNPSLPCSGSLFTLVNYPAFN